MYRHHPHRDTLDRFSQGGLPAGEAAWIEDHLRGGCSVCQRTVDDLLVSYLSPSPCAVRSADREEDGAWNRMFSWLEQRLILIQQERSAATPLVDDLLRRPARERDGLARSRRYQTRAVCELLIDRSFEAGFEDPPRAVEVAELAVELTGRLDAGYYGDTVVQDLRARAWAYLGDARRISSDLAGAEAALSQAEALAEEGSADPLEEARILELRAFLLGDQGWFEKAAELLAVAVDIYEEVRDPHLKGRALIGQGLFLNDAGRPEKAAELIRQGLSLIGGPEAVESPLRPWNG